MKSFFENVAYAVLISIVGLALFILSAVLASDSGEPTGFSLVFLVIGLILFWGSPFIVWYWVRSKNRRENAQSARQELARKRFFERERLIDEIERHKAAVSRNLIRAVKTNDYGAVTVDKRGEALVEFFASIRLDHNLIELAEATEVVFEQLQLHEAEQTANGFAPNDLPFDGLAFEHWVASGLEAFGWSARVTQAAGDQGIDVIAEQSGNRLGLQCKLYSSAIGNKAVQEAFAGLAYHGLDKVAVISNADYTSSARELAASTGVLLLSHHDIPDLFGKAFPSATE